MSAEEQDATEPRFRFIDKIDAGGFGDVWKVEDTKLRRNVAVKLFAPGGSGISSPLDHAQALARAAHPNVVAVHDLTELCHPETEENCGALIMELLDGPCLSDIQPSHLKGQSLLDLCTGILSGVDALHAAGVAHDDLHSKNIMLHRGVPKVLDVLYRGTLADLSEPAVASKKASDVIKVTLEIERLLGVASYPRSRIADFHRLVHNQHTSDELRTALHEFFESGQRGISSHGEGLREWHERCLGRFHEVLSEPGESKGLQSRYKHGYYAISYHLPGAADLLTGRKLLDLLAAIKLGTPRSPWRVARNDDEEPYSMKGCIESRSYQALPRRADFWIASPEGYLFLLRGYDEDSVPQRTTPGSCLSAYSTVHRLTECICHAHRLATYLDIAGSSIPIRATYGGLRNRQLTFWPSDHYGDIPYGSRCREEEAALEFEIVLPVNRVTPNDIAPTLSRVLKGLFDNFGFPEPLGADFFATQVQKTMSR